MKAEGITGKIHIDFDVFIKKPHLLDRFYEDKTIDAIAQQEENYEESSHFYGEIINAMHIIGYPSTTRPNWKGIINVGVIGFNNEEVKIVRLRISTDIFSGNVSVSLCPVSDAGLHNAPGAEQVRMNLFHGQLCHPCIVKGPVSLKRQDALFGLCRNRQGKGL